MRVLQRGNRLSITPVRSERVGLHSRLCSSLRDRAAHPCTGGCSPIWCSGFSSVFFAGMLGIGGGIVIVPLLLMVFGMEHFPD